ncbi:Phosphoglycerate kinase [Roseibaca ekhonensis]|jgi:phosphoglycerate kinase|uniref:Phosphoglycerate kinase n=1 Tax=Roseinatronobacter ekhonensis TaxID=254356 RepID=A0A3B0M4L3_9RHOB|nr:phosphoglycerate kinase [Roseibaca ekhonensis]SUZ30470.1 Phosphoglycerate kinase [Roseibaca ekhonensis]
MAFNTLDDMDFAGRTALVRVDINVPMAGERVTDATRIERILPTIRHITEAGGKVVLLAHFDRPKGKRVPEMSLALVRPALEEALGQPVGFAEDCIGMPAKKAVAAMAAGDVLLLENTRFHAGEEKNDKMLAAGMAALGDIFVNDAFSAAHRAHASTTGIADVMENCAGRLMAAELTALEKALGSPERPVAAVVGGAKVSTKLDLLSNLIGRVDHLIIGGGMANTFLVAQGVEIGTSLAERDMADTASEIMAKAEGVGCTIHLPRDIVVAREFAEGAASETVPVGECPADAMILDAGPDTVAAISELFAQCRTLVWNGPLGAFEITPFDMATNAAAQAAAERTEAGALISVAGGGDTVAALNKAGAAERFSYVSTAGGAFLEWLEGKTLPGVAALEI